MSFQKSRYRPKSYSYRRNSRRQRKNYKPLIIFLVLILTLGWVSQKTIYFFYGDDPQSAVTALVETQKGVTHFSLAGGEERLWTKVDTGQKLLVGDKLRTSGNGLASVDILGSIILLRENTQIEFTQLSQKKDGTKKIKISLEEGEIWGRVVEDEFSGNENSFFAVSSQHSQTNIRGTIFDIKTDNKSDEIRLIKGKVDVDIFEKNGSNTKNIVVGLGQKLTVDDETFHKVDQGEIVLEVNDTDFIQSDWNLRNLEQFSPQEAAKIRGELEKSAKATEQPTQIVDPDLAPPIILEPANGSRVPATEDLVVITGTVPENVFQVSVNGYTLTKFQPGDRKWSYFASRKFGTMLPGENKYSVKAIRRDGKESEAVDVTIFYDGFRDSPANEVSRNFQDLGVKTLDINNFEPPQILKPVRLNLSYSYQTSSEVVTISGIVDPKTNRVEVNGFQLRKFKPGDTDFSYIANAKYGNMRKGENIYTVTAYGPDGKKSSSSIKIVYTPLEL